MTEENDTATEFDEAKYLERFTPLSTLLWLQTVMTHPNNSVYLHRLYFLLGLFFSMPEENFGKRTMMYSDAKKLFDCIEEPYAEQFMMLEDFEGFDQSKLIPFFLERCRYYFFYGNFERPIEHLKQLTDIFFFRNDNSEFIDFKNEIIGSLEFQTVLLEHLKGNDENKKKVESVYVPSQEYYDLITQYFIINKYYTPQHEPMKLGEFNKMSVQEIVDKSVEMDLFGKEDVRIGEDLVWLAPHLHLNIFINRGCALLKKYPELESEANGNHKKRLTTLCRTFFTAGKEILAIFEKETDGNLLENVVDFAVFVDGNKLLLFGCVEYCHQYDITEKLNLKLDQLINLRKRIKEKDEIGIYERGDRKAFCVYSKALEIWLIPIYEPLCLDTLASVEKTDDNTQIFPFSYMDLKAVFDKIEKPFDFLKFLKEDTALKERTQGIIGEFMDRFYFFLENGNSHMRSGRTFHQNFFSFHMWSDHIFEESWQKYQDSAYEEIELKFGDFFNRTDKYKEGVYRMMNTADLSASYLVKWNKEFIWLFIPPGAKLEYEEIHIGAELVAPMICEYLKQFEQQFEEILLKGGISIGLTYSLTVLPKSLIDNDPDFANFKEQASSLNEDNPITFQTRKIRYNEVRTFVVYDYKLFPKLFGESQNIGERFTIKNLVKSILEFSSSTTGNEEFASNFIDQSLPLGIKGYSVEQYEVSNTYLNDYDVPRPLNKTEIGVVERMVSEFLIKNEIKPGDYKGEEAKSINYKIYTFLQTELELEIAKHDKQFIIYAYRQLELAEGERYRRKIELGMRSKGRTDYNILEATKESENEASNLNVCIKHIVHTSMKVNKIGNQFVTGESWTKLTAISNAIMAAASIYDYIEYDLWDHTLQITEDHLIIDVPGETVIDNENLQLKHTEIKIERAQRAHTKAKEKQVKTKPTEAETDVHFRSLNEAFLKDLGFSYDDMLFVLHALSILPLASDSHFPVVIKTLDELHVEINKADTKNIVKDTVKKILDFICLYRGIYKIDNLLYPSNMMKNKERINVSPIIKLENDLFLYGLEAARVGFRFWSPLVSGEFPFKVDSYPHIKKLMEELHREDDLALEKLVEEKAIQTLGRDKVEARINNFKRLSVTFERHEDCGEIDLLCVNDELKTIFVIDSKNINKKMSIYHIKQSIREFFEGNNSYYSKLTKKKEFIENNIQVILKHFNVIDLTEWKVREAFVSEEVYFAAYYNKINVDFILIDNLGQYLSNSESEKRII